MGTFIIQGGKTLKGEIIPQGAKNEASQLICKGWRCSAYCCSFG